MDDFLRSLPTLIGVLIGGVLTWINTWFSDRRVSQRSRNYSIVRVICILENLISACENIVTDEGEYGRDGLRWAIFNNLKIIEFPTDLDWKLIDHKFTYALLTLQTRLEDTNRKILAMADIDVPPDYDEFFLARKRNYSILGLHLVKLLKEISFSTGVQIGFDSFIRAEKTFNYLIKETDEENI